MGSVFLPHLKTAWHVDQAILSEDDRVVVIRFGREEETQCMIMDEILFSISEKIKNFAVVYLVNLDKVPDFNQMYELDQNPLEPFTIMFFYRNKHMMCDFGTGNNNKLNFMIYDKQDPNAGELTAPKDRPNWGTGVPSSGVKDWIEKNAPNSKLLSVNFFFAQNEDN